MYYVNERWLGGMLTNWKTISGSIKRLKEIDARMEKDGFAGLTKKEKLNIDLEVSLSQTQPNLKIDQ